MPLRLGALYDALINAGAEPPLAERAAEEAAQFEARFAQMDTHFAAIETRLARIETRLEQTPTKADLAELRADVATRMTEMTRNLLIGSGVISAAILIAKFFVP